MGVPKFYRWISERYPCLSEVVKEYQIPEFDNLYLDMNGIIHVCSHPNDNDPHFRISEEKMFKDIFHYIEVLFRLIQPKDVFFMAVDGVAPRAKMNQQRGRRFRSAKEGADAEKKARDRGEVLPKEERFDSNCITPGTEFMARLDSHLQYFVTYKMSNDKMWQNCKVIYSGHETPGEGEHKIMEYIRYTKSQPNYNPNTRHCLYGLDADLMMLGLTSHEPHFSLLREEVRFGGKKDGNSRTPTAEETTFHLLHLSLMREYISYEFAELKSTLPFPFDLENIIDDWVLMGFLVGNDFIPHLPNLHINKDALPLLYQTYKAVLPELDGYLNSGGKLNLARFEKFMEKLAEVETEQFYEINADLKYFNSKKSGDGSAFKVNKGAAATGPKPLEAFDFGDDDDSMDQELSNEYISEKLKGLGLEPDPTFLGDEEDDNGSNTINKEFQLHKRDYYITKMHYEEVDSNVLLEQATCYVTGIQWILNYYYNGICSWSWYYPFHYSPYVSDVRGFSHLKLEYSMGRPFMPYEQLLAVLPPLSKKHLPESYRWLMTSENSPLKEFYPDGFQTDLNGKQQDWEAVVLIPFIDENRLLAAMSPCNAKLTQEQQQRNVHGPMYIYSYTDDKLQEYKTPQSFPNVGINHAHLELLHREKWEILPEKIYKGLCKQNKKELYFAGFPTMKHIAHKFHIAKESVKVFQQNSRGDNFILDILEPETTPDLKDLANQILGKTLFIAWPHLVEAKVRAVADGKDKYNWFRRAVHHEVLEGSKKEEFYSTRNTIATNYHDRWGINVGKTEIIVYASPMTGRQYIATASGRMSLEKSWSDIIQGYAYQAVVRDIAVYDPGYKEHLTPLEYFPPQTKVFMLGQPHYGCMGKVLEIDPSHKGRIRVVMTVTEEPNFDAVKRNVDQLSPRYLTGYHTAQKVGISSHLLARMTGTVFLMAPSRDNPGELEMKNRLNIGLNLKNNVKNEEVIGYTRKTVDENSGKTMWLYSLKTVEAILEYQEKFPEVFDHLSNTIGEKDIFFQDDVFGQETYKERVSQLTKWLKESAFAKSGRQKCGTPTLDEVVVSRIVKEVDEISKINAKAIKMQVRPHLLFKPNPLQGSTPPDPKVNFKLFDRVINCREGFSVPLGARGTIIGIHLAEKDADVIYDILFDEAFEEGLTLGGPTTEKRCYRLHWASIINISHGNRLASTDEPNASGPELKRDEYRGAWNNYPDQSSFYKTPNRSRDFQPKPHRNNFGGDSMSPQPPDPNQLPSPSGLYVSYHTGTYDSGITNGVLEVKRDNNQSSQQDGPAEIRSASEVDCIVYGSYYAHWSKILQQGVRSNGRNILCFSCVPRVMPGPKAFQLLIYFDVKKALENGITFHRVSDRRVTSMGDKQGFIRPNFFLKVVDCETNSIIYSPQREGNVPLNGGRQSHNVATQQVLPGHGRGRALGSQQPQGIRLYENIWSQVQREDRNHVDLRPAQSEELSEMLGISSSGGNSGDDSLRTDNRRTEVSVEEIFRGALAYSNQRQDQPSSSQAGPDIFSLFKTPQSQNNVPEVADGKKDDSPAKSAFVPTQVIRNRTPRKPKPPQAEGNGNGNEEILGENSIAGGNAEKPVVQQKQPQQQQQQQRQQQHQQSNSATDKPKRQVRNRLAVKFGQPMEDT